MYSDFLRHTSAKLLSALLLSGWPAKTHGFIQTSSFVAWSNAPGASLQEFFGQGLPDPVTSEPAQQLTLDSSNFKPLCPTGVSALTIFDLSDSDQRSSLQSGLVSSQINHQFNSVPQAARFWTSHFPDSLAERWTTGLPLLWPGLCQGDVVLKKLGAGEDLNTVFHNTIKDDDQPRLVILTPVPSPPDASTWTARASNERRGLPEGMSENSSMPASAEGLPGPKTGVFWRYTFLSDYLIVGILVMVLLFIPPVVMGAFALQSIESPKGLKTKMVGQVSEVKGN